MGMEKRKMEKLGVETSLLGFGCMRFPVTEDGKIDEAEAERMLDKAYAAGVNYFDTAYPYHGGESERVVGRVMKKYDRGTFYLATKLPCWEVKKVEDVDRIFEEQLNKLQTEYIDFYLMHALNKDRFREMVEIGCIERLEQLKAEGRIKYLGFSFHDGYSAFENIINYRDWDFCQIQLNYMDANDMDVIEQAGIKGYKLAEEKQVPLVIMEPVKGGSLAAFPEDITKMYHDLDPAASMASFALRWVGSLPDVKVVLSGMSTMEQVEDNLKTFGEFQPLSDKEKETIDKVVALINSRVQNGCTGCGYCMPCPKGIDIPTTFRCYNRMYTENAKAGRFEYMQITALQKDMSDVGKCVECGKCESHCPQHLEIRKELKAAAGKLTPWYFRVGVKLMRLFKFW